MWRSKEWHRGEGRWNLEDHEKGLMPIPMLHHYSPFAISYKWASVGVPAKVKHQTFIARNGPEVEGQVIAASPRHLCKMELRSATSIMFSEERGQFQVLSRLPVHLWSPPFQNLASVKRHREHLIYNPLKNIPISHTPTAPPKLKSSHVENPPDLYAHNKAMLL